MTDRRQQNYLITQLVKGVPLDKIDTRLEDNLDDIIDIIRQSEAQTEKYINKRRMLGNP